MSKQKRKPPVDKVQGAGTLEVGITEGWSHVVLQFTDPEWWIHFTPNEARHLAMLLNRKAREIDGHNGAKPARGILR